MNCYILAGETMEPSFGRSYSCSGGEGAGLIRDRPAAALSLAERLADPCCLIGTGSLLTRAHQQGKQPGSTGRRGDQLSTVIRKTPGGCPGYT